MARRMILRSTYPRYSFEGITPSICPVVKAVTRILKPGRSKRLKAKLLCQAPHVAFQLFLGGAGL